MMASLETRSLRTDGIVTRGPDTRIRSVAPSRTLTSAKSAVPEPAPAPAPVRAQPSRVMVVDDHPIVRTALVGMINAQPDLMVCAEAGDPGETIAHLGRAKPELLVMDFTMPGRSGIELIKDVIAFDPNIRILVLSMHEEDHYAERVLRAGASGFIMKSVGSEGILAAIRQVLATGVYLSSGISSRILRNLTRPVSRDNKPQVSQLSDREFEIFVLSGEGHDAAEIAAQLRISRKTVDVHRANIKRKLGLPSTTALIRYAVQWTENERKPLE